ncbi:TPA: hypothetical protein DD449_01315 [Candidatus Berkelbacteria bacterium]|uniref:Uncharacterized protein n=1 Tax=Berkelbacteria bacterium GW2011_GWE1_39_12 TaxID=1618337 RepID=A0A0G4B6G7_9BACT|nr:MAG: hypothetical protein UT28_C0001G0824 [Berkelbacteria bacterium GW2011_GWE1_39_12]HBO60310.1 hypothetical protein [Candidatus Berkelbacteria bacterium]
MEDLKVQVLLEAINQKFDTISEALSDIAPMKADISVLKEDVHQLKEDMSLVKLSLQNKASIKRVEKIEADVALLQQKIA